MAQGQFAISQVNPNDTVGGGGCVCDPTKQRDCKPPYVVMYGNDMESLLSPHVVACERCVREWVKAFDTQAEPGLVVGNQGDQPNPAPEPDPLSDVPYEDEDELSI